MTVAIIVLIALQVYFLPAAIAVYRRAENAKWITLLTLLSGWTGCGWVAAFIWACLDRKADGPVRIWREA